jgi:hypothetical protein
MHATRNAPQPLVCTCNKRLGLNYLTRFGGRRIRMAERKNGPTLHPIRSNFVYFVQRRPDKLHKHKHKPSILAFYFPVREYMLQIAVDTSSTSTTKQLIQVRKSHATDCS